MTTLTNETRQFVSKDELKEELVRLGVKADMIVEAHVDDRMCDVVVGGARSIVDALLELATKNGTIVMSIETLDNSEPSTWGNVEPYLCRQVRSAIPPYDVHTSDLSGNSLVAENFRHRNGVETSNHPQYAYAAWGKYAKMLCNHQSLNYPLAEESPAARMYELKGYALLLGSDFDTLTSLHLAEYRTDDRPICINGACISTVGGPMWKSFLDLDLDGKEFLKVRALMAKKNMIKSTTIGGIRTMFFPLYQAIDEATSYLETNSIYELYR